MYVSVIGNGNTVASNLVKGAASAAVYVDGTGNSFSCNRIVNNAGGFAFDSSFNGGTGSGPGTPNTLHNNAITGNGTGLDASALDPSGTPIDASNNWWGCKFGPGSSGCDAAVGNVDFTPVAVTLPACVACVSAAECDDGDVCNGAETCNTGTGLCQAGTPLPDSDADGVCDVRDNCPATFNPAQSDGDGNGVGDLCDTGTLPTLVTLTKVRLRSNKPSAPGDKRASVAMNGVLDAALLSGPLDTLLNGGVSVGVTGAGLGAPQTMVFPGVRCLPIANKRFRCIGTQGEVLNLRGKKSGSLYTLKISANNRSFDAPLSAAAVQVTLSLGAVDRRDAIPSCTVRNEATATCKK